MNTINTTFSMNPWKEGPHRGCFYKALKKLFKDHGVHIPDDLRSQDIKTSAQWRLVRAKHHDDISTYSLIFNEENLPAVLTLMDTLYGEDVSSSPDGEARWEGPRVKAELTDFCGGQTMTITVKPYSLSSSLRGKPEPSSPHTSQKP